jgi:hypothetical protein
MKMVFMDKDFVLHDDGLRIVVKHQRRPDLWIGFIVLAAATAVVWWVTK